MLEDVPAGPRPRARHRFRHQRHRRPNKKISRFNSFSSLPARKREVHGSTSALLRRRGARHQAPAGGSRPPRSYVTVVAAAHPLRGPGNPAKHAPVVVCVVEAAATAASAGTVACCSVATRRGSPSSAAAAPRRPVALLALTQAGHGFVCACRGGTQLAGWRPAGPGEGADLVATGWPVLCVRIGRKLLLWPTHPCKLHDDNDAAAQRRYRSGAAAQVRIETWRHLRRTIDRRPPSCLAC